MPAALPLPRTSGEEFPAPPSSASPPHLKVPTTSSSRILRRRRTVLLCWGSDDGNDDCHGAVERTSPTTCGNVRMVALLAFAFLSMIAAANIFATERSFGTAVPAAPGPAHGGGIKSHHLPSRSSAVGSDAVRKGTAPSSAIRAGNSDQTAADSSASGPQKPRSAVREGGRSRSVKYQEKADEGKPHAPVAVATPTSSAAGANGTNHAAGPTTLTIADTRPPAWMAKAPTLKRTDPMMNYKEVSPIVISQYRLLFFAIPKVSCSVFKMLFRRMEGYGDWTTDRHSILHDPRENGLKYLADYPLEKAQEMMTSPRWTRAMFLRDPMERMLSAYLDKAVNHNYVANHCCNDGTEELTAKCKDRIANFASFVELAKSCLDGHWVPQADFWVDFKFWKYINFFGYMNTIAEDTKRMLELIGEDAWESYGQSGWGVFGNESIYGGTKTWHATNAKSKMDEFYTPELKREVELMFRKDYHMFNFTLGRGSRSSNNLV